MTVTAVVILKISTTVITTAPPMMTVVISHDWGLIEESGSDAFRQSQVEGTIQRDLFFNTDSSLISLTHSL